MSGAISSTLLFIFPPITFVVIYRQFGASIPFIRTLYGVLLAWSTVIVSPSAMLTTLPVIVCAWQTVETVASKTNKQKLDLIALLPLNFTSLRFRATFRAIGGSINRLRHVCRFAKSACKTQGEYLPRRVAILFQIKTAIHHWLVCHLYLFISGD